MFAALEPQRDINDVCLLGGSGLFFLATETSKIQCYYLPDLGPAPRWAAFLENVTEELEESAHASSMFADYKFVSRDELQTLGLDRLIGTEMLQPYMHGFYIELRAYEKARAVVNPMGYEEWRRKQVEQKIEAERASRISAALDLPTVNRRMAKKLQEGESDGPLAQSDGRFSAMFHNPDFEVDERSKEFKRSKKLVPAADKFVPITSDSESDGEEPRRPGPSAAFESALEGPDDVDSSNEESNDDEDASGAEPEIQVHKNGKKRAATGQMRSQTEGQPRLYELKDGETLFSPDIAHDRLSKKPLAERLQEAAAPLRAPSSTIGSMETSFQFMTKQRQKKSTAHRRSGMRGIRELGLDKKKKKHQRR